MTGLHKTQISKTKKMKQLSFAVLVGATLLLSAFTTIKSVDWKISDDYSIKFKGKDAEGIFKTMSGDISFDENDLNNSRFSTSINVTSINTGNGMKNKIAKSDNWFDADKYPSINFISSKFSKSTNGYLVEGTIEMHGIKKQIVIPFTFSSNVFKGNFSVNRTDFGVGTMEGMSKKVSNEIALEISVPVTKK
jgi:polyisoprenoid-binding protein YceI